MIHINSGQKTEGSALLIVMMLSLLLIIIVSEVSFSSQTSFGIAKNHVMNARMNATAETGFAYAKNIIHLSKPIEETSFTNNFGTEDLSEGEEQNKSEEEQEEDLSSNNSTSIFSSSNDNSGESSESKNSDKEKSWQVNFPTVQQNNTKLKMKISLEESKINLNRLVDSKDEVDKRMRAATVKLFQLFDGTEDDVNRIIDYIDRNTQGTFESGVSNAPLQSFDELFKIKDLEVKYSLKEDQSELTTLGEEEKTEDLDKDLTLSDFFTIKSTGKININFAHEKVLDAILNDKQEASIKENIISLRANEPIKSLNQLALNQKFKKTFKKVANYLTVNERTYKILMVIKPDESELIRGYLGYLYKSSPAHSTYIYRTERFSKEDIEFKNMEKHVASKSEEEEGQINE